jgi:hypothetical protein
MFYLRRRMEERDRARLWRLYGWYTALMTCGSCFGALAWFARTMTLVNSYKASRSVPPAGPQAALLFALAYRWGPVYLVAYAIEFMCLCAATLMVLDRMSVFAAPEDAGMQKRWAAAGRIVMAVVVLGNAVGLAANAAAAVHVLKASEAESSAVTYYLANNSKDANYQRDVVARTENQRAGSISSVQSICEVAVLLLIIAAFVVVGVLCARILRSRLKPIGVDAGYDALMATVGRTLRRHMLGTTGFIFVTFLLRSVYSTMYAVALQLRDFSKQCPGRVTATSYCDATCHNVYSHISFWISNTPEFPLMIILISSPLALLVALWGMTPKSMLQLMKSSKRGNAMLNNANHAAATTPESEISGM